MEKEIDVKGLKIFYEVTGPEEGHPVVLLHGWGCDHSTVRFIADSLNDRLRVISIDLPGHGCSAEPEQIWGTHDFAGLIRDIIGTLNLKKPSVIGHSFGGRTAIALASDFELNKIVLVDSAGIKPRRSLKYYAKVYSYKAYKKIVLALLGKEKGGRLIEKRLLKAGSADYRASSPKMRAIMSKCVNEDLKKILSQIKSPTLLIWGENDTATPLKDAEIMSKLIPDAGLVSFAGCGHYSFLDNPFGFKNVIREFFKPELSSTK